MHRSACIYYICMVKCIHVHCRPMVYGCYEGWRSVDLGRHAYNTISGDDFVDYDSEIIICCLYIKDDIVCTFVGQI